jgi:rhodanese-related sulfurtransferase
MSCTTLAAERGDCCTEVQEHELREPELKNFLDTHPDAMLIDVREAFEHAAAASTAWHGRTAHSVPLSRLADRLAVWLRNEQRPLVFFCRSGARGAKAAHCLQRLGYRNAWHVTGGLSN